MGVIMSGMYRRQDNPTITVPAPVHGEPADTPWWYDHLASHAHEYAAAGYSHLLLPPVCKTSARDFPSADGFGVYWEYDLGSKSAPTRFGDAERLQRLCAILHANGIKPLVDWVPHQRSGGKGLRYDYVSATGKTGRFPKDAGCFRELYPGEGRVSGRVPQDPVPAPWDDFMFGDELCPVNSVPKGYVQDGLNRAGDWLYRRLDLGGCRNDCTKGQAISAVRNWINYGAMRGKLAIGEYAEGNKDTLAWWCSHFFKDGVGQHMTYDFEFKYRCRDMCNAASKYDMRRLVNSGLASKGWPWSGLSVPFVENHDSDTNGFGAVVFNKMLAYAYLLTSEGFPSIYYRDWSDDEWCYGLKKYINNLIWIHENLAGGTTKWRHAEYQFVVYERLGYAPENKPGVLVGLNNDTWNPNWKHAWVATNFGGNRKLHDYSGNGPDLYTNRDGWVYLGIPPNEHGHGYVCYAPEGYSRPMQQFSWRTAQEFEGADDLDIPPARVGEVTDVTRIWVAKGAKVMLDVIGAEPGSKLTPVSVDPTGATATNLSGGMHVEFRANEEGWHRLRMSSQPSAQTNGTPIRFILRADYMAPKHLAGK